MKIRIGIFLVVVLALVSIAASLEPPVQEIADAGDPVWIPLVEGAIDYQLFLLSDPNKVYVTRMHRDNPNAFIESSIAQGRISGAFETVRGMYFRYDQAINYWDPDLMEPSSWGGRNRVVVAINGFFFDFGTGIPESGQVYSSWFTKRYEVNGGAEGFVWKSNGQAFMGECIYQDPAQQNFIHIPTQTQVGLNGVNRGRDGNELILFTPQYGPSTLTPDKGESVEVIVQVDGPTRLLQNNLGVTGVIREIRDGQGSSLIPFDHVVLSAHGLKKEALMAIPIAVGDPVEINQRVQNEASQDCEVTQTIGWGLAYAGIGGYPIILKNGEIFTP
ncbi:MAG TPA: hypothetical protein VJ768_08580, partial [Anaerolineales bacterium]|nr:hypothetical protein [Anaerolineales bacterium]